MDLAVGGMQRGAGNPPEVPSVSVFRGCGGFPHRTTLQSKV